MYQWLVIGISGVTCGGKTSLTFRLRDLLIQHFQSKRQTVSVVTISQDDYFLKPDDPRHVLIPSLGHLNWDIPAAIDFVGLYEAAQKVIEDTCEIKGVELAMTNVSSHSLKRSSVLRGILLIEGFLILNHRQMCSLFHLKYYMLLSRAVCVGRRIKRTYDPPDVPGYFEQCIWPEHVKYRSEILGKGKLVDESDSLTMDEVQKCMEKDKNCSNDLIGKSSEKNAHTASPSSVAQTGCSKVEATEGPDVEKNKSFYMRIGGNVLPLTKFGAAGLGMVNNIRVLNGGVMDKETIAQLVFKDILDEINQKIN